jgi:ABC-type transport system substrate-binding protein
VGRGVGLGDSAAGADGLPAGSDGATLAGAVIPTERYPVEGEVTCASGDQPGSYNDLEYTGNMKSIEATDERTVVFTLCAPDGAFLPKVAFIAFAINDSEWLQQAVTNDTVLSEMNGTGAFALDEWRRGDSVIYSRNDTYWGEPAAAAQGVLRWNSEAAARLQELQAGTTHGIDNVGPTDFETVRNDPNLQLVERPGLNTFYLGFNNRFPPFDNEKVRQAIAMGIDRQRIIDTFYPPGSEVASHFTPCALPFGCEGDPWYEFDATAAKALLEEGLAEADMTLEELNVPLSYRDVVRGYLPEPNIVVQEIQAQLRDNLGIQSTIDLQESGTFIANANAGELEGIHLLGWGADYPEITNFLDFHFGAGASDQFGDKWEDITSGLQTGATSDDEATRQEAYAQANNAIKQHVPMIPIAHAGSATAYVAGLEIAQASPLSNEQLFRMAPPSGDQIVFMQNAEPISLYCADETDGESLRACEQVMEGLYGYETNGTEVEPALAESCDPNEDNTVWTCTLREGVTFHDGATLDAGDVVASYAVQWDMANPFHIGNTSGFYYWGGLWGGYLNTPPAEE